VASSLTKIGRCRKEVDLVGLNKGDITGDTYAARRRIIATITLMLRTISKENTLKYSTD
jgi:hypothetical protein